VHKPTVKVAPFPLSCTLEIMNTRRAECGFVGTKLGSHEHNDSSHIFMHTLAHSMIREALS
jgi:hypothetical protein